MFFKANVFILWVIVNKICSYLVYCKRSQILHATIVPLKVNGSKLCIVDTLATALLMPKFSCHIVLAPQKMTTCIDVKGRRTGIYDFFLFLYLYDSSLSNIFNKFKIFTLHKMTATATAVKAMAAGDAKLPAYRCRKLGRKQAHGMTVVNFCLIKWRRCGTAKLLLKYTLTIALLCWYFRFLCAAWRFPARLVVNVKWLLEYINKKKKKNITGYGNENKCAR